MIGALRIWAAYRPLSAACAAVACVALLFIGPVLIFETADITDGTGIIGYQVRLDIIVFEWAFVVLSLLIVLAYDWGAQTGIASRADPAGRSAFRWLAAYPAMIATTVGLTLVIGHPPALYLSALLAITALNLAVAVFEELVFRGILMHGLRSRMSPLGALLVSSAIFGLFHMTNLFAGQAFNFTVFQVVNATALGLVLGAAYLQTNTLWAPVALHFLWNMAGMISLLLVDLTPVLQARQPAGPPVITAGQWLYPAVIGLIGLYTYQRWQQRTGRAD